MHVNELGQMIGDEVPSWRRPSLPPARVLTGRFVTLVPYDDAHLPEFFAATCGPDDDSLWTYMATGPYRLMTELRADIDRQIRTSSALTYSFVVDGRALGGASYLRAMPSAGSIEVGSVMLGTALQRTAAATEAQYLLAKNVFDLGYRRYEWKCDSLNEASRRAAHRLGFTYEGLFRQALVYKGRNRDTAWYAMTDSDWARLQPAYEEWLSGCDDEGRQSRPLGDLTRAALAA